MDEGLTLILCEIEALISSKNTENKNLTPSNAHQARLRIADFGRLRTASKNMHQGQVPNWWIVRTQEPLDGAVRNDLAHGSSLHGQGYMPPLQA
jgi:hypothetical protein